MRSNIAGTNYLDLSQVQFTLQRKNTSQHYNFVNNSNSVLQGENKQVAGCQDCKCISKLKDGMGYIFVLLFCWFLVFHDCVTLMFPLI